MKIEALTLKLRKAYLPRFREVLPETKTVIYYDHKVHEFMMDKFYKILILICGSPANTFTQSVLHNGVS